MNGETDNYYLKITSIRRHRFSIGIPGYIVEGISQKRSDDEFLFFFICQTDLQFQPFYSECIKRRSDYYLNMQGFQLDNSTKFVKLDEEIKEFVKTLYMKRMKRNEQTKTD